MDSTDAPLSDGPVMEWRAGQGASHRFHHKTDQIAFEHPHIKVRGYTELRNHQSPDDIEAPKEKCRIPSWWETPTSFETHQKNITGAEYTDAMHSVWNRRQSHLTYYVIYVSVWERRRPKWPSKQKKQQLAWNHSSTWSRRLHRFWHGRNNRAILVWSSWEPWCQMVPMGPLNILTWGTWCQAVPSARPCVGAETRHCLSLARTAVLTPVLHWASLEAEYWGVGTRSLQTLWNQGKNSEMIKWSVDLSCQSCLLHSWCKVECEWSDCGVTVQAFL